MAQERIDQVAEPEALPTGLTPLQVQLIERLTQAAALKQVMVERDSDEPALRMVDAVVAARYRDCVEQRVETAADAVLVHVQSSAGRARARGVLAGTHLAVLRPSTSSG